MKRTTSYHIADETREREHENEKPSPKPTRLPTPKACPSLPALKAPPGCAVGSGWRQVPSVRMSSAAMLARRPHRALLHDAAHQRSRDAGAVPAMQSEEGIAWYGRAPDSDHPLILPAMKNPALLRQHQRALYQLCEEFNAGLRPRLKRVVCYATPGGGKALIPVIAARRLIPGTMSKLCWVVPRLSLQKQAEREFTKPGFQAMLRHIHQVRQSTNDLDPSRGLCGYVTTYSA